MHWNVTQATQFVDLNVTIEPAVPSTAVSEFQLEFRSPQNSGHPDALICTTNATGATRISSPAPGTWTMEIFPSSSQCSALGGSEAGAPNEGTYVLAVAAYIG